MASRILEAKWDVHPEAVPAFFDTMVFDLAHSRGAWLYESKQRRDYLDLTSSFGRDDLGYNHRRFRNSELHKQGGASAGELESVPGLERLRKRLADSSEGNYDVGLFATLDEVYQWVLRAALGSKGDEARILELRWDEDQRLDDGFQLGSGSHLTTDVLEAILREDDGPVAGLWVELPSVPQENRERLGLWMLELQAVCRRHEALLILNEVRSGFGRSGRWWDWQNFEIEPDLVVFGGGAKVPGVFRHRRLTGLPSFDALGPALQQVVDSELLLDVIEDEGLLGHASVMGAYLSKVLSELETSYEQILNVCGRGLRASFELPSKEDRDRLLSACLGENLILQPLGERSIGLNPPLDVRADAIGRAAAQLEVALQAVYEAEL